MKRKILALGVFSLCTLALFVGPANAWFGLCSPWNHHNRYTTNIICRPYNAFTPIAWGNLVCDGCCPSPCNVAGGCMPLTMGAPPWCSGYGQCGLPCAAPGGPYMGMGGACGPEGCFASDMGMQPMPMQSMAMQPMPMQPIPMQAMPMQMQPYPMQPGMQPQPYPMPMQQDPRAQPFNPPMPSIVPPGTTMAYPPHGVSQAGYYPNNAPNYSSYYPAYPMSAPMGYNPYPAAWPNAGVPYYWYGYGSGR